MSEESEVSKTELVKPEKTREISRVLETPAADPRTVRSHHLNRLEFETDPDDVHTDLENGIRDFIVVDSRKRESFEDAHVPGAISLHHRTINAETTRNLSKEKLLVVYCWGPGCNAATKAAVKLSELGFHVKEMIGGIEYWWKDGYKLEGNKANQFSDRQQ